MISDPTRSDETRVTSRKEKTMRRARPNPRRFYSAALSEAERLDLPVALEIDGMDEEIAVLRLRLRRAIEERPEDAELLFRGIDLIAKAVAVRYRLSKKAEGDLSTSLANAVRAVGELLPGSILDG